MGEKQIAKSTGTASQFAWGVISGQPHQTGEHGCWLCGGGMDESVPRGDAISKTFCLDSDSIRPGSEVVCVPCFSLSQKSTFDDYAQRRPELGLKPGYASSWRNYSHVVFDRHHSCPGRAEWREWLLSPPEPPFLFVLAVSSQKHLIYKSKISGSRDFYHVQMEDVSIEVNLRVFSECLMLFEVLIDMGFSKKQIGENSYNSKMVLNAGVSTWRRANDMLQKFRLCHPEIINMCGFVAQKKETRL